MAKAVELSRVLEQHIREVRFPINGPSFTSSSPYAVRQYLTGYQVSPERKLPALYVLDSIAKNVGGAYIHCLGHNLYHTFMDAYALVPPHIRKKLDEMVKTWKEPVPGSTDLRPVFPPEKTRPIETTLIRFRTLAVQGAQQQQRQQGISMPPYTMANQPYALAAPQPQWQNTGTPPQSHGLYGSPHPQGYSQTNGYSQVRIS